LESLLRGRGECYTNQSEQRISHFLADALDSTVALSDGTGGLPTSYTYAPFGAANLSGSATGNAFDYTGRENDGTGLHYYRARYYDSIRQRFISEDPVGFRGTDINLYTYVHNSPLLLRDPYGLAAEGAAIGGVVGAALGMAACGAVGGGAGAVTGTLVAPGVGPVAGGVSGAVYAAALCAGGATIAGAIVGSAIQDLALLAGKCSDAPTKEDECWKKCKHLMPSPSRDRQASEFRKCWRECMGRL
jgi:RHS repeat-associated protein